MLLDHIFHTNIRQMSSRSSAKHYDIVISGGGMIGTTLACALAQAPILNNLSILMIESGPKQNINITNTTPFSNRVSSVNLSSKHLLETIGAWEIIANTRAKSVDQMKIWGSSSNNVLDLDKDHNCQDNISFIVENDLILQATTSQLATQDVDVFYQKKVAEYNIPQNCDSKIEIKFESGEVFYCDLLLGTDGPQSQVRKSMNVNYTSWNYNQKGIVATLKINAPDQTNSIAWQRFTPNGTIALLPLTNELSSLVWSTTCNEADLLLKMKDESFVDALNSELNKTPELNRVLETTENLTNHVLQFFNLGFDKHFIVPPRVLSVENQSRAAFPLGFGHAHKYVAVKTALLGDSAHKVHPLAGQGVNMGFGDIKDFVEQLSNSMSAGYVVGDPTALTQYETRRQRHNLPIMAFIELLHRIYRSQLIPAQVVGNMGFQVFNALSPIKRIMMNQVA